MANFNRVLLIGNLTRDPQLRYTPNQVAVCDFGMAVNRRWASQDGQQREETCFVNCTAWARSAETLAKYMTKGQPLFVEGRLTFSTWDGPDGKKRSKLEVTVERFQFLGRAGDQTGPRTTPATAQGVPPKGTAGKDVQRQEAAGAEDQTAESGYDYSQDVEDDTIPF